LGNNWTQFGLDIDGEATTDGSGLSVAMSADGTTVAIGAPLNDGNGKPNSGHVRVYSINSTSGNWTQVGLDIDGEAANDQSGTSVAMSADGKTIVVGAPFNDGNNKTDSGHVRVYSINSTSGDWMQVGLDIDGEAANDQSGGSVAISADGKTIIIAAKFNDGNGNNAGHVRVYSINATSVNWTQVGLDVDGEAANDQSGWSVAMSADGKTIVIGAIFNGGKTPNSRSGHARVYSINSTSGNWTQVGLDIDGEAIDDRSGNAVAISADGKTIAVGATLNDGKGSNSGHVRVYSINSTSGYWSQVGLDIDGQAVNDQCGYSVAMSPDSKTIVIGARLNDENGLDAGNVRVYSINSTGVDWTQIGLDIDGEATNDFSGSSVAMSADGKTVAIGAPFNDGNNKTDSGHARVYKYLPITIAPTKSPTKAPTKSPTKAPTKAPSKSPTKSPTKSVPVKVPVPITIPITSPFSTPTTRQPTNQPTTRKRCGIFGFSIICPFTFCGVLGRRLRLC
jgi:FG-GAP repeat